MREHNHDNSTEIHTRLFWPELPEGESDWLLGCLGRDDHSDQSEDSIYCDDQWEPSVTWPRTSWPRSWLRPGRPPGSWPGSQSSEAGTPGLRGARTSSCDCGRQMAAAVILWPANVWSNTWLLFLLLWKIILMLLPSWVKACAESQPREKKMDDKKWQKLPDFCRVAAMNDEFPRQCWQNKISFTIPKNVAVTVWTNLTLLIFQSWQEENN